MKVYSLSREGDQLRIDSFPNAVKAVQIETLKARQFAHLALHKTDLDFAEASLHAINKVPEEPAILREALWRTAVTFTMKCFAQHESRSTLNEYKILGGDDDGLEVFKYFKSLRDKHFIHDQNSYSDCKIALILNSQAAERKVETTVAVTLSASTLDQTNFGNLSLLITKIHKWVAEEADKVADSITAEHNAMPYEELITKDEVKVTAPKLEEIHTSRK